MPPCQFLYGVDEEVGSGASDPALAEGGVVHHHAGIVGDDDLPSARDRVDPVIEVAITRTY